MENFESFGMKGFSIVALITAAFFAVVLAPSQAWANWNFDPSCSSVKFTETEDPITPNAFLMLDQSGSMGSLSDGHGNSLWSVAVGAINQSVAVLDGDLRFGLGLFPATQCVEQCFLWWCWTSCYRSGSAEVVVSGDNSAQQIQDTLNDTGPGGGTPTWDAFDTMRTSQSMNEAGRPAGGVLVTDGQPCCHSSARDDAIAAACQLREEGYTTYAVGLGGATDQDFNNKMAAALGTGCCGPSANPDCTNGLGADPCTSNVSSTACHGAYHANNQTEFRNVLLSIGDEISCTFPIDTSLRNDGKAPEDPRGTRVEIFGPAGWELIDHRDYSSDGEGWYYANPDNRDQVTLTSGYCNMVHAGHIHEVATQAACECQQMSGDICDVDGYPPGFCPLGIWECERGFDFCEPLAVDECPVDCPGYQDLIGENCITGSTADEIAVLDPDEWQTPITRCDVGEVVCPEGADEPVCEARFRPMPEICDGMDNSCDGKVDNITESWTDWFGVQNWSQWAAGRDTNYGDPSQWHTWPVGLELPTEYAGAACGIEDICRCADGSSFVHRGEGDTVTEEFEAYIESRPSHCHCVAPLGH